MARPEKKPDVKMDQIPRLPVKTAVTLSFEANQRLKAAVMVECKTQSEIVELLVLKYLGGYFVGKRGDGVGGEAGEMESAA